MPDISVPLQDILTDPDHPTDLSTYLRMKPVPSSENSTLSYHHRFREVIESEPSYPNPRYGLALLRSRLFSRL